MRNGLRTVKASEVGVHLFTFETERDNVQSFSYK